MHCRFQAWHPGGLCILGDHACALHKMPIIQLGVIQRDCCRHDVVSALIRSCCCRLHNPRRAHQQLSRDALQLSWQGAITQHVGAADGLQGTKVLSHCCRTCIHLVICTVRSSASLCLLVHQCKLINTTCSSEPKQYHCHIKEVCSVCSHILHTDTDRQSPNLVYLLSLLRTA